MSAPDRANYPARKFVHNFSADPSDPTSNLESGYIVEQPNRHEAFGDKHDFIDWGTDKQAQKIFKERGWNKGTAGTMKKQQGKRVETAIAAAKNKEAGS